MGGNFDDEDEVFQQEQNLANEILANPLDDDDDNNNNNNINLPIVSDSLFIGSQNQQVK